LRRLRPSCGRVPSLTPERRGHANPRNVNCDFAGQTAFVTGGAGGIGAEVCRLLAAGGAHCIIADVNATAGPALADELSMSGLPGEFVLCDVTKRSDISHAFGRASQVDILVNCAGYGRESHSVTRITPEECRELFAVNLHSAVECSRAVIPLMRDRMGGRIVNVSSIAGLRGARGQVAYSGAKAGILGLTISLARELLPDGITVNAVVPGFIDTPLTAVMPQEIRAGWGIEQFAVGGRLGTPHDVAACIAFLASPAALCLTGAVINVDGGIRLGNP